MEINYKLVYELREAEQAIFAAERKVRDAEIRVVEAKRAYEAACYEASGAPADSLVFSGTVCMARGILTHVYLIKVHSSHGSPENKCIFCGCDNFDGDY
jgi:hypothetical protein